MRRMWMLVCLAGCAAKIDQSQVDAVTALTGDPVAGEQIYQDNCVDCHEDDGSGEHLATELPKLTDDEAVETILSGPWIMPNYVDKLTDQEVADVFAYLRATWP